MTDEQSNEPDGHGGQANSEVMATGSSRWRRRVLLSLTALGLLLLLALAGIAFAGYRYSQKYEGRILPGAAIAGVDVGGMGRAEAVVAVRDALTPQLDREITLTYKDREWTITPRELGARSNARRMVRAAVQASDDVSFLEKTQMRLFDDGLSFDRQVAIRNPRQAVRGYIEGIASAFDREAKDASLDYSSGWVEFRPEKVGRAVKVKASSAELLAALENGSSETDLVVNDLVPETTIEEDFEKVLLVRIGENKLYLYEDGAITREWVVATGLPEYPTPTGQFSIELKRYMPTWVNPAPDTWGASLPASIPPGPSNPLGLRALNWTAPAIRFHGTTNIASLGHQASHGCVRLSNDDAIELYDLVDEGVAIVSVVAGSSTPLYEEPTVVDIQTTEEQTEEQTESEAGKRSEKKKGTGSGSEGG